MEYNLDWKQPLLNDESIKRIEYQEYESYTGIDLNKSGDIRIAIQNQDEFLLPSRSYLYIEGALTKTDGTKYAKTDVEISIINNGLMYLFDRVDYQLGNQNIEGYSNLGQASTLKSLITYPKNYQEAMSYFWMPDAGLTGCVKNNSGFTARNSYIIEDAYPSMGNFSATIPLSHIFGFCENYDKIIYGIKHELTLRRTSNINDAILKSPVKDADGNDKYSDGIVTISKLSWRMPHVTPTDNYLVKLSKDIQNKIILEGSFLNRQCESIAMVSGQTTFDWRLNVTAGAEKPRYIVLAFQTEKSDNQIKNPAIFNHCDVKNAYVQLNSERYPEMDLQLNFENNNFTTAYKMLCDYYNHVLGKENCSISLKEYKNLYPLIVFDTSKQSEKLKNAVTDIRIKATFNKNIPKNTVAYALVLSDRIFRLESDGNKMNFVY